MKTSKKFLAIVMSGAMVASMAVPSFAAVNSNAKRAAHSVEAAAAANAYRDNLQAAWDTYVQTKEAAEAALGVVDANTVATAAATAGNTFSSAAAAAQANGTVTLDPSTLAGDVIVKAPVYDSATAAALANAAHEAIG